MKLRNMNNLDLDLIRLNPWIFSFLSHIWVSFWVFFQNEMIFVKLDELDSQSCMNRDPFTAKH